jgi:hypothetical protein
VLGFLGILVCNSVGLHNLTIEDSESPTLYIANSDIFMGNCTMRGWTNLVGGSLLSLNYDTVSFEKGIVSAIGGATIVIDGNIDLAFTLPELNENITVIDNRGEHTEDTFLRTDILVVKK